VLSGHDAIFVLAGLALLATTLGLTALNRLAFPKFFVYFPAGLLLGPSLLGLAPRDAQDGMQVLERVTEFAVIVSLIVAGLKIGRPFSWSAWRSTSRLILFVMPLSILGIALVGHLALGLPPGPAILLGAILAPTDPVLAGAVQLERPTEDDTMRFGLTSEAGLNDGFAFPFVFLGLYLTLRADAWPALGVYWLLKDLLYAVAIGLLAGYLAGRVGGRWFLRRARQEAVSRHRREIVPLALLLVAYGSVQLLGGYGFLAAFAAGIGLRHAIRDQHDDLREFTDATGLFEALAEAASIILLGALFRGADVLALGLGGIVLAAATLLLVRPLVVWVSTMRGGFTRAERALWAWFGIRGIGSLYYLAFAITFGLPDGLARTLLGAVTLVVLVSNVLHGVTAYPVVRRLGGRWLVHP